MHVLGSREYAKKGVNNIEKVNNIKKLDKNNVWKTEVKNSANKKRQYFFKGDSQYYSSG